MGSRGLVATVAVASVLLIAGCTTGGTRGSDPGPTEAASLSYAHGATDLVVQARSGGGLLPPSLRLAEMPDVSIYGDGRVVLLGSHSSGAESPLLPVLSETRVTPEAMTQILAAAREGGALGPDRRYDLPGAYDLWTVAFTVTANGVTHHVSAFALGFDGEDRLAPPGEMDARRKLSTLYARLRDLRAWLPAGAVAPESAYESSGIRVFAARLVDGFAAAGTATPAPASSEAGQDVRDWPFAGPPESFGAALDRQPLWRCAVVQANEPAAGALDTAKWGTRWRALGGLYQIVAVPLLPHESGCPAGV